MKQEISVIGTGALGTALTHALTGAGFSLKSLFNHHPEKARELARSIGITQTGVFPHKKNDLGNVTFITVPDRHIEKTAQKLATLGDNFSDFFMFHCSGSKTSDSLSALKKKGATTASFHPIQTFTETSGTADFQNIYFDVEGDNKAVLLLNDLCNILGSKTLEIEPKAKPFLHAAAVMASNNLVALMESAGQIAEMGGIERRAAQAALLPLVQKTLKNISESEGIYGALSGPVKRGDASTIAEHLKLLKHNPQLLTLYKQLGSVLVELSDESSDQSFEHITRLLSEQGTGNK